MELTGVLSLLVMIPMIVIGPISNFVTAHYFLFKSKQKSVYFLFLVHLAFIDMIACILIPILFIPQVIMDGQWFFGDLACKYLFHIPITLTAYNSCWILFGIIVDRYRAIVHPLAARFTRKKIHAYCALVWICSFAQVIPQHMTDRVEIINNKTLCAEAEHGSLTRETELAVVLVNSLAQCVVPVSLTILFFYRIHKSLHTSTLISGTMKRRFYRNRRVLRLVRRTFLIYMSTLTLSNIGTIIKTVIRLYHPNVWEGSPWIQDVMSFMVHLIFMNCVINCFIYAGTIRTYRTYISRLFPFLNLKQRLRMRKKSYRLRRLDSIVVQGILMSHNLFDDSDGEED